VKTILPVLSTTKSPAGDENFVFTPNIFSTLFPGSLSKVYGRLMFYEFPVTFTDPELIPITIAPAFLN
jgi:hypothetical protein